MSEAEPRPVTPVDSPVLEYGHEPPPEAMFNWLWQVGPAGVGVTVAVTGFLVGLAAGGGNVPVTLAAPAAALMGAGAFAARRLWLREDAGPWHKFHSAAALIVFSVAVMTAFRRAGVAPNGQGGWSYWFTDNPGFRYDARWAARPLWVAGAAAVWFVASRAFIRLHKRPNPPHEATTVNPLPCPAATDTE